MSKYLFFFLCFNFLFSENCLNYLYDSVFSKLNHDILQVDLSANIYSLDSDSIQSTQEIALYIDLKNKELSIDLTDSVILMNFNSNKIYHKETNQMYIENPDSLFLKQMLSIFNVDFSNFFFKENDNNFILENIPGFDVSIRFGDSCTEIDVIEIVYQNLKFITKKNNMNILNSLDFKNYLDIPDDYFEFDLR